MSYDGDEFLSDEDMFSPKKTNRQQNAPPPPVTVAPGCKDHYISKYKKLLNGIPPPPDHTNPDFNLDKLLDLWKDNQALIWEGSTGSSSNEKEGASPLGVCLNADRSCEEFELMSSQLCERYIWSETAATTSTVYMKLTQSAKKRRKANGWGQSPRTRISYLTRRMTTFQKDNIASTVAANKTTQILVARSEPGKKVSGKGNGLKGKRALFLSPEHENKFQTPEQGKSKRLIRRLTMNSSPVRAESERLLRNSGSSVRSSEKKRCSRSLFSTGLEPTESSQQQQPLEENAQQIGGLSTQHRLVSEQYQLSKMLWAVSNALKAVKVRMTDPEFKTYAGRLFKATTEKWLATSGAASGDRKTSTSDAMLVAAKSLVEGITGRKMSPKSAKKTAPKSHKIRTPEKTSSRDENNPPTANTPDSLLSEATLIENGVFPLERVGILAEKPAPGGNVGSAGFAATSKRISARVPSEEEMLDIEFDPDTLTTRKRKRQDTERLPPTDTEIMVCQRRNRTPRKTPTGSSSGPSCSFQSADTGSVPRIRGDQEDGLPTASPTFKRQKIETVTPVKSKGFGTPLRRSPRLSSSRTPLKLLPGTSPSKKLKTIDETPLESPPDGNPQKSTYDCRTPSKPQTVCDISLNTLRVALTPSKSPAVKPVRGILTPTLKTPDVSSDGAVRDVVTPQKCVTFDDDDDDADMPPLILMPGTSKDDEPRVLRSEVQQRRSMRCYSADLPPPKLVREIDFSPSPTTAGGNGPKETPGDNSKTCQTPTSRRRSSAPTPGQRSPPGTQETPGTRSGRQKVSLSLTGARKSKTPEEPGGATKPDDVTTTPRRSSRRVLDALAKSSPN